jgi:hypothetical protein
MKAAAAHEPLPADLSSGDLSRLLGHEFVAEKVTKSSIPQLPTSLKAPAADASAFPGKPTTGVNRPSRESSDRDIVLSPDPEPSPSIFSQAPPLESPTVRKDLSPGSAQGPGGEAWEDYLAKRVGAGDEKALDQAEPSGRIDVGDQMPGVSRIPSPSKRPQRSSLPETSSDSPPVQTVRPPSVVNRPLSTQSFRSQSLRIRVSPEEDRFVGERIRRFSSQEGGIAYLLGMGFGPKAAAAATAKFGSDLQAAVAWLLEQPGRGVDPADVLASTDCDPFPLTPSPSEKPAVRRVLNVELISGDSPPGSRTKRHVAGGESKIPSPPRRDGPSPNGSPVKRAPVISPRPGGFLKPPTGNGTQAAGMPEKAGSPPIIDRIGDDSDASDEEEEVAVGTELGRPQVKAPGSPLGNMVGSLWGGPKTAPGTPTGQTKIERGLVAHNVEK